MQEGTIPEVIPFDATLDVPIDDQKYVYVTLFDYNDIGKLKLNAKNTLIMSCWLFPWFQSWCNEEGPKATTVEGSGASCWTYSCSKVSTLFVLNSNSMKIVAYFQRSSHRIISIYFINWSWYECDMLKLVSLLSINILPTVVCLK